VSQQPPDTVTVHTADNVSIGYSTAGLGSRFAAQLIDNVIAIPIALLAFLGYSAVVVSSATSAQGIMLGAFGAYAFAVFVYFGYFLISEAVSGGRTPGKTALGLRVIQLDGSSPTFSAILARNLVRVLDWIAGIGIVVMFVQPLSRRLGDLVAGTVVVRERGPVSLATAVAPAPVILRTPDAGPPIEGIERLGSVEHNALRVFLSRPGLAPDMRVRLATEIASRMLDRLGISAAAPERMWPPELLLERLYLQLDQRLR
jgi:uncharacterized RDD family membrane protein YckC